MIRQGEVHYIDAGLRAGPAVVVSVDELNANERERPWVLPIVPVPADQPYEANDALAVRTGPADPVQGFVIVYDVRRPSRRWYHPVADPERLSAGTMRRVIAALHRLTDYPLPDAPS